MTRVIVMAVSLGLVGVGGYASWYGWGAVSRDTGPTAAAGGAARAAAISSGRIGGVNTNRSLRSGSVGNGSFRSIRVK